MTLISNPIKILDNKPPIWLMRQAGRYLPEYMAVRKEVKNFLEFCYDVDKATKVTLQPIKRFGFDAAIIFSDILVLPHALGWEVDFKENIGPVLKQFKSKEDFKYLQDNSNDTLEKVYEIVKKVRKELPESTSLIGFAGGPWTVMTYMLEGKGKQDFRVSKKFIYENKDLAKELLDFITEKTIHHLINQIKSGANIIKIFDSWAGILLEKEFDDFVIKPTKKIIKNIKEAFPNIPIITFPKGAGLLYEKFLEEVPMDVLAIDPLIPLEKMKLWSNKVIVQGNLDPVILLTNKKIIKEKIHKILSIMENKNFIFNLGHGILPETPPENVEFLVECIREYEYK
ncbi:uroporphyrinogen decarboxylase [Rickettsia sp. MEAM1 (Bemisia tabaci)]|uniref:uroporphyrinogen decarboxylase n=1 Tax=unclassified Rickettsia TaxID=114295 RepID=UPI0003632112|nr:MULTISPECIES: uroporphyrinogen decarboxylase [unclassified Rickettsia]ASX27852.1 uroporphyrinogen decarboxylase [Rickettsia sp. MEAM1 (Bemisia tabaci)]ODA37164.1 uroporphyrinogen decarboxylase [Rickettsia sp. wq]ODA37216.1 uroporphyrinogen decarboxylase [Rickettsia sp. wb]